MYAESLVLNRNFFAIHVCDYQKVMCLLFRDHARVIDQNYQSYTFDEWKDLSAAMEDPPNGFIHTTNFKIAIPDVIALRYYDELPLTETRMTRRNLYKHYRQVCCYCGKRFKTEELNLDHVVPRCQGGRSEWDNLVVSCVPCNSKKDRLTPQQAGLKMFYQPSRPMWKPSWATRVSVTLPIRKGWQHFIDQAYWNSELKKD